MKGRSIAVKNLKSILESTYSQKPSESVDGYELDKSLSTDEVLVYAKNNHAIVAFRGTTPNLDWMNNYYYARGQYESTPRFQRARQVYEHAVQKYGEKNISVIGHSQGAIPSRLLGKNSKEIITLNPAYMGESVAKNEYDIRSSGDIVSGLKSPLSFVNKMFGKKSNDIVIPSKTSNPITEHKVSVLDRLEPDRMIGENIKRLRKNHDNALTDGDLYELAHKYKIAINSIKNKDEFSSFREGNYIINLNGSSHWTCLIRRGDNVCYFDSFGVLAPLDVEQVITKVAPNYAYNTDEIQGINQSSCGYYCLACLKFMKDTNEDNVYQFFDAFLGLFSKYHGRNEEMVRSILS